MVSSLVALVALLWVLRRIGWTTIAAAVGQVGPGGAALLCSLALAETVLDGAALCAIVGRRLRLAFAVVVNSAGSTLNLILPWESGEILKTALLHTQFGSRDAVSGTLIWNYIFKLSRPTVSALTAALAWVLCRQTSASILAIVSVANVLAFLPYLLLRVLVQYGAAEGVMKLLRWIPGVRRHPSHWLELGRNIDKEVRQFWQHRRSDYIKVFVFQAIARSTG